MREAVPVIVAAIENSEGKILLMKRALHKKWVPNAWNMVTGQIEEDEKPLAAAFREVREKTGLSVELIQEFPVYDVDYEGKTWCTFAYRFITGEKKPQLNEERREFLWVGPDEIPA